LAGNVNGSSERSNTPVDTCNISFIEDIEVMNFNGSSSFEAKRSWRY
jgi:hypothetical protein